MTPAQATPPGRGGPVLALGLTPALQRTMFFERFRPGEVNRAREVAVTAAGKCVNVGLALAVLGDKAYVTGFNGGAAGRLLAGDVVRRGATPAFTEIAAETRTCTTVIDGATGDVTELVQEAPAVTRDDLDRMRRDLLGLLPRCSALTISGNLPAAFPADAYAPFAEKASSLGIPWLVDSRGAPLLATLPFRPLLAKLNRQELADTFGGRDDGERRRVENLRRLTAAGARWALMTDGGERALLVSADGRLARIRPERLARAVNPVGSGDCTAAGVIHAILRGREMPDAVAYGLACGTANARTRVPAEFDKPPEPDDPAGRDGEPGAGDQA